VLCPPPNICWPEPAPPKSGITAIEQFSRRGFDVTCYEARSDAGGVWLQEPNPAQLEIRFDEEGRCIALSREEYASEQAAPVSPMYNNLRTNLPHPLMSFRAKAMSSSIALYPAHQDVLAYLHKIARQSAALTDFGRRVVHLRMQEDGLWMVTSCDHQRRTFEDVFDYVYLANGHYNVGLLFSACPHKDA
jgi:cation diffusion facilitator CzcD-associated flavoprotein CzcO